MKVEFMIYIYGAVCASMIVFNIIYNLLLKGSESRMQNRCQKMRSKINAQISRLAAGKKWRKPICRSCGGNFPISII